MKYSISIIIPIIMFSFNTGSHLSKILGTYYDKNNISSIEITKSDKGILEGTHCFVNYNGSRIDCCIKNEIKYSFKLHMQNYNCYEGLLYSCYNNNNYIIRIKFIEKENILILSFLRKDHPFMPDTIKFYKKE